MANLIGCSAIRPISSDPYANVDGSPNAPLVAAGPQYPFLLNSSPSINGIGGPIVARPPWRVAGVDYPVGIPDAAFAALRTPTSGNLPAGATISSGVIHLTGSADIVLDTFDLHGLTVLLDTGLTGNVTITNCFCGPLGTTTNSVNIRSVTTVTTPTLTISYCTFDGGGVASDPNFQLIQVWCILVIRYCWIRRAVGGAFSANTMSVKFSLLERFDYTPGSPNFSHANALYIQGSNDDVSFNCAWTGNNVEGLNAGVPYPVGLGAAFAAFTDFGTITGYNANNNTMISSLNGGVSFFIVWDSYNGASGFTCGGSANNNFMFSIGGFSGGGGTGAFGPFQTDSGSVGHVTTSGNIDMQTGGAL